MAAKDPLLDGFFEAISDFFILMSRLILYIRAQSTSIVLEPLVLENPRNVEKRKSEFAIKLNRPAPVFEKAWEIVALDHPKLFPRLIREHEEFAFRKAVTELLDSNTQIVRKQDVSRISGLSIEKVNLYWPRIKGNLSPLSLHYGYIEDDPR